jgi:hypothetical protein
VRQDQVPNDGHIVIEPARRRVGGDEAKTFDEG